MKKKLIRLKEILAEESSETKDMLFVLLRIAKRDKIDDAEKDAALKQFQDILKLVGLGALIALPAGTILVFAVIKLGQRYKIDVLPSAMSATDDTVEIEPTDDNIHESLNEKSPS
ncbi:MAG: hypothetical protein HRT89_01590 [Lentisphaeria bacterium]|nr:hypothetical protein [Lentisphaeria bacterium]NQZ66739.1 hypothetical protein [Lentisphaeria bacterium]